MSGIAGISGGRFEERKELLATMLDRLEHRGPDNREEYHFGNVSIGRNVLVVDGDYEEHEVEAVVDGYLYGANRVQELSGEKKLTDSEEIVELLEKGGPSLFEEMSSGFALAMLYKGELLLARDPYGLKPLYYGLGQGQLLFASEIKAFVGLVSEINSFPPGHYWMESRGFKRYFDFPDVSQTEMSTPKIAKKVKELMERSVSSRLPGEGRVGVLLSGGIDSSVIAALVAKLVDRPLTFTIGLKDAEDVPYARMVARYLGTEHHEYIISEEEMVRHVHDVIYHLESFDMPLVRSALANYLVAKIAADHGVKTVFVGEGGDELFGGYHHLKELNSHKEVNQELVEMLRNGYRSGFQRVDRMNMANSIEPQVPFMDQELVEFALSIPIEYKLHDNGDGLEEKWILRKAFEGELPDEIIHRRKKKFFTGSGSADAISHLINTLVSDEEYQRFKENMPDLNGFQIRNKEEYYYYSIFSKSFPGGSVLETVSQTENI